MNNQPILTDYEYKIHRIGRWSTVFAILLIISIPLLFCIIYDIVPHWTAFLKGAIKIIPMFYAVGAIELINYAPMLGSGGTYLAFITGNLTNMKIPAAQVGLDRAEVEATSEEGEVISTISVAVSTIVTDVIIIIGMLLVIPLTKWIDSVPVLKQVFSLSDGYVIAALFGALGVVFIAKSWKIAIVPLLFMICVFVFVPGAVYNSVIGALSIPIAAVVAVFSARFMFNKGWLAKKEDGGNQ
jgi:hypothetical protein